MLAAVTLLLIVLFFRRDRHYSVAERLVIIRRAMENGNDIEMTYFTYAIRRFTRHQISPQKIRREEYLDAFDHYWEKIETFKISRIKELREISRS